MLTTPPSAELLDELLRGEREVSAHDQLVLKVDGQRRGVLLDVLERRVRRLVRRQRAVQSDREAGAAGVGHQDGGDELAEACDRDLLVSLEREPLDILAVEILKQEVGRARDAIRAQRRRGVVEHEPHQARAEVTVEEVVLELVLIAAKAAVAGAVAVIGALLEQFEGVLKDREPDVANTLREARAAGERVVDVYLSL